MKTFIRMLKDESGASAAEYALILAIVGSALAVAAYTLGSTISGAMNSAGSRINSLPGRHLLSRRRRKDCEMKTFIRMLKDQSGASAAEYALILAIVGSALAVAAYTLGNTISGAMNAAGNRITDCQDGPAKV